MGNELRFNYEAFRAVVQAEKEKRDINWKALGLESGVTCSTLTRFQQGKEPTIHSIVRLSAWAGVSIDDFTNVVPSEQSYDGAALATNAVFNDPRLSRDQKQALGSLLRTAYKMFIGQENSDHGKALEKAHRIVQSNQPTFTRTV